jgi:hypothetical protein
MSKLTEEEMLKEINSLKDRLDSAIGATARGVTNQQIVQAVNEVLSLLNIKG